jgi:benzoyl-CoA reductase/2-hydroxyglutaryl-CoA dehydratase subunit BcrC/BadD/HgdB
MKSGAFMDKETHTAKVRAVIKELNKLPKYEFTGKKVLLTGITAEPDEFLNLFTECGIAVVGDDLAQESRQYRTPIPEGADPIERLAGQWFDRIACSMVHEDKCLRGEFLVDMAKKYGADGIAVCLMRFCDVEEYDYPFLAKSAQDAGLHCLCLEIDQSTQNNEQSHTKIQSFAEM